MKISKLFHWLYACLMLLPIFIFIPNAFYYGFNEHAQAETRTDLVPFYYYTNEVSTYDDFVENNAYLLTYYGGDSNAFGILCFEYEIVESEDLLVSTTTNYYSIPYIENSDSWIYIHDLDENNNPIQYRFKGKVAFTYKGLFRLNNNSIPYISRYDKMVRSYTSIEYSMSITDSMATAWNSTFNSDLFGWAYDSFLAEPVQYVTNLFGMPQNDSIITLLSYWLAISIIYLCFDVIMYIPLLVHRWLDKGVLE